MVRFLFPRDSGEHRVAAIGLFRALLTQCREAPLSELHKLQIQNIVRNRYKLSRYSGSKRRLRLSFEAGYEALDLFDAAVAGDESSKQRIDDLLKQAEPRAKLKPPRSPESKKVGRADFEARKKSRSVAKPKSSILDRPIPLEKLTGRRHVPVLFKANFIPVLRVTKPQPKNLSGYLNKRIQYKQKLLDESMQLDEDRKLAELEDDWDTIIDRLDATSIAGKERTRDIGEELWRHEIDQARQANFDRMTSDREKHKAMSEKMQDIVDKEQALYDEEKEARRLARVRKWNDAQKQLSNQCDVAIQANDSPSTADAIAPSKE